MMPVRAMWAPSPYRGGFAFLDDTERSSFPEMRAVYDHLAVAGVRATRTVWAFEPEQPSGLRPLSRPAGRGVTLEDTAYREYCGEIVRRGCELALHGASGGNNTRLRTLAAFDRLARLGSRGCTFVPHARNAENLYLREPFVAAPALRPLFRMMRAVHRSGGDDPGSPWFWGDVCRERVRFMRLYRTEAIDTLEPNPSLPYFEREKPLVRGWFATTDRALHECTTPDALAALVQAQGLCILRQRLAGFGDRTGAVAPGFVRAVRRLRNAPGLWVDTVEAVLDRRERIQSVALAWRDSNLWIINTGDRPVDDLQLVFGERSRPIGRHVEVAFHDGVAAVRRVPARAIVYLDCATPIQVAGPNAVELDARHRGSWTFGHGAGYVNLGNGSWSVGDVTVAPESYHVVFDPAAAPVQARARAADHERALLFAANLAIAVRRVARQGGEPSRQWRMNGDPRSEMR